MIFVRAGFHALAAAVRQSAGGFQQQQAAFGAGGEDSPAAAFLDEMFVIFGRLEAEEGEPKAVLAARFAMASARIADQVW